MILMVLGKTDRVRGHFEKLSMNTKRAAIFIDSPPTVSYLTSPRRNSPPPSSHHYSGKIQRLFTNNPKFFRDLFACKIVLAANHQQPENIQRLFRLQSSLSRKSPISRKYSRTFQPLAAATSSINQQQQPPAATTSSNQQQQPAAATSSSNQQQQPAAATSSSNQQQQPAAATSSSNQQKQPAFILPAAPTQSTPTSVSYHYGS